jgi:hypothetical protein
MSHAELMRDLSEWVIQCAWLSSLTFIVLYTYLAPWWKYRVGRAIIALDFALLLALTPTVIGLDFGASVIASPFWTWLTLGAFALITPITVWRCITIWRLQRRGTLTDPAADKVPAGEPDD